MEIILIILIGILVSGGTFLLLQKRLLRVVMGLSLISQAANLVIFVSGMSESTHPPMIKAGESVLTSLSADPLPQALILTAIVIGFAMLAFFVVLLQRVYLVYGTDNIDQMKGSDQ